MGPIILTAVVSLAIGIWLGMPARYSQTPDDIAQIMESGEIRRRKPRRRFTPLAWLQRKASAKSGPSRQRRSGRGRSGFKLEAPEDSSRS